MRYRDTDLPVAVHYQSGTVYAASALATPVVVYAQHGFSDVYDTLTIYTGDGRRRVVTAAAASAATSASATLLRLRRRLRSRSRRWFGRCVGNVHIALRTVIQSNTIPLVGRDTGTVKSRPSRQIFNDFTIRIRLGTQFQVTGIDPYCTVDIIEYHFFGKGGREYISLYAVRSTDQGPGITYSNTYDL